MDATIIRSFQAELFSRFLPSAYSGNVNLAATKPGQFMPKFRDGDNVYYISFVFKISFLPKYRVIYFWLYSKVVRFDLL